MKFTLRIPTQDQYAFAEIAFESKPGQQVTPQEVKEEYDNYIQVFKVGEGIPDKDMNMFLDSYLLGNLNGLGETYHAMSPDQQKTIQCVKRSLARIKSKQQRSEGLDTEIV